MKVAIIGAGVSGLSTAYHLKKSGISAVVFEKSRGLGGRVNSRHHAEGFIFDTGATSIAPRGKAIENVILNELPTENLVEIEKPIWVHANLKARPSSDSRSNTRRFVYRNGIQEFANLLAVDCDVRLNHEIEQIERKQGAFRIDNEDFDVLVLTAPIPQTSQLLWSMGENRPVANAVYRSCISVMLGFEAELPDLPYHALLDTEQIHPMTWISVESQKSPGRCHDHHSAMVLQLSTRFSLEHYQKPDEWFIETSQQFTRILYGDDFTTASVAMVKKWKYSQPTGIARFEAVNIPGSKLLIASDGLVGGRIEDAFECGVMVANQILAN